MTGIGAVPPYRGESPVTGPAGGGSPLARTAPPLPAAGPLGPGPSSAGAPVGSGARSGNPAGTDATEDQGGVELVVPAEATYLALVRTSAASLAARWAFSLEDLEDLRLAVAEACALVMTAAVPGTRLRCGFRGGDGTLWFSVAAERAPGAVLDEQHFGWAVLEALAQDVSSSADEPSQVRVAFRKSALHRP